MEKKCGTCKHYLHEDQICDAPMRIFETPQPHGITFLVSRAPMEEESGIDCPTWEPSSRYLETLAKQKRLSLEELGVIARNHAWTPESRQANRHSLLLGLCPDDHTPEEWRKFVDKMISEGY